jgi:hypothetical protein
VVGREAALAQESVARLPTPALVERLALLGFDGVYVDCDCYRGRAAQALAELQFALGPSAASTEDGRLHFFPLTVARNALAARYSPAELDRLCAEARRPVLQVWAGDFSYEESDPAERWHWCSGRGELILSNLWERPRTVRVRFASSAYRPGAATLLVEAPAAGLRAALPLGESWSAPRRHELTLELPPGRTVLRFSSDAVPGPEPPPGTRRHLAFAIRQFEAEALP